MPDEKAKRGNSSLTGSKTKFPPKNRYLEGDSNLTAIKFNFIAG